MIAGAKITTCETGDSGNEIIGLLNAIFDLPAASRNFADRLFPPKKERLFGKDHPCSKIFLNDILMLLRIGREDLILNRLAEQDHYCTVVFIPPFYPLRIVSLLHPRLLNTR